MDDCTHPCFLPPTAVKVEMNGVPADYILPSLPTVEMKGVFVDDFPAPVYRRDEWNR